MLYAIFRLTCSCLLLFSSACVAQTATSASALASSSLTTTTNATNALPDTADSHSQSGKAVEFTPSDTSISCSVVRYDKKDAKPVLHLLCPEEQVFAPLRVHLKLSWNDIKEIPSNLEHMLVDIGGLAQFKSKMGNTEVKLRLREQADSHSFTKWIKFTMVTVGLVKQK